MKVALILSLVALASARPKTETFHFPGLNTGKIVGGVEADPHEFPFIVDMRRGSHYCAGSIISPEWVVTAAHCSQGAPSAYTLTAGDHNINVVNGTEQTRQVVGIIVHPSYGSPLQYENDIALMKVDPPFEFNEYVQPVVLPESTFEPTMVATVTGWGALTEGGSSPSNLMKVDVPYVDDETCNRAYGGSVAASMVCYGEGGKDSCQGDSGGPIVCGADKALCGIVSWGQGCARPNYPGVYTETSYYAEWIRTATVPTAEDDTPAVDITNECGGLIEESSARINFHVGENVAAGQHCVWTFKAPYDTLRFNLASSGLQSGSGLYVTKYDASNAMPGQQVEISTVGQNYTLSGGMVFITLAVGQSGQNQGFSLTIFSSGFGDASPALSGFQALTATNGSYSYPENGGQYRNNENALFVVSPETAGNRTLRFTRMDLETGSACSYDAVTVFTWNNNQYQVLDRICGAVLPAPFNFPSGLGLLAFTTDSSITASGFTFNWQ